jgi:hypothetical protein
MTANAVVSCSCSAIGGARFDSIQQIDYDYEHHFIEHEHEIADKVVVFGEKCPLFASLNA